MATLKTLLSSTKGIRKALLAETQKYTTWFKDEYMDDFNIRYHFGDTIMTVNVINGRRTVSHSRLTGALGDPDRVIAYVCYGQDHESSLEIYRK